MWQRAGELIYLAPGWSHEVYSFDGDFFQVQADAADADDADESLGRGACDTV